MTTPAQLVALCASRGVVEACWDNNGVPTPVLIHAAYDYQNLPVPAGTPSPVDPTVDIGFVYTDLAGRSLAVDVADLTVGPCWAGDGTPPSPVTAGIERITATKTYSGVKTITVTSLAGSVSVNSVRLPDGMSVSWDDQAAFTNSFEVTVAAGGEALVTFAR